MFGSHAVLWMAHLLLSFKTRCIPLPRYLPQDSMCYLAASQVTHRVEYLQMLPSSCWGLSWSLVKSPSYLQVCKHLRNQSLLKSGQSYERQMIEWYFLIVTYNLKVPVWRYQNIFWLEISVNDKFAVHSLHTWQNLCKVVLYQIHRHCLMSVDTLDKLSQTSARSVFKYIVQICFILEGKELFNYVHVIKRAKQVPLSENIINFWVL